MIERLVCLSFLSVLAVGCMSAEAREDEAVLGAIDALRDSSSDDVAKRRELIAALEKRPATNPLAREARDACVEAYRLMLEGKETTLKVKADLERLGEAPKNAMQDLAEAEEKLKKSELGMQACQKAAIELSVKRRR